MKTKIEKWWCALALVAVVHADPARATVTSVTPIPSVATISVNSASTVSIRWNVTRLDSCDPAISNVGTFWADGLDMNQLGASQTRLVEQGAGCSSTTLSFRETLLVPVSVVYQARKLGVTKILYTRDFSDSAIGAGASGTLTLNLAGGGAGAALTINRLSLRFDDDSPQRVVPMGAKLGAYAEVTFSGNGQLQGVWEIADPASTMGDPIFRPLRLVRESLVFGREALLRSPALPTEMLGVYLLRLRITQPALGTEVPTLRYLVLQDGGKAVPAPKKIALSQPRPSTVLSGKTRFAWQPVRGARGYQVEFYERLQPSIQDELPELGGPSAARADSIGDAPVAGMLVDAKKTAIGLSELSQSHLEPGKTYLWRVLAIDALGNVIAISELWPIRVP